MRLSYIYVRHVVEGCYSRRRVLKAKERGLLATTVTAVTAV